MRRDMNRDRCRPRGFLPPIAGHIDHWCGSKLVGPAAWGAVPALREVGGGCVGLFALMLVMFPANVLTRREPEPEPAEVDDLARSTVRQTGPEEIVYLGASRSWFGLGRHPSSQAVLEGRLPSNRFVKASADPPVAGVSSRSWEQNRASVGSLVCRSRPANHSGGPRRNTHPACPFKTDVHPRRDAADYSLASTFSPLRRIGLHIEVETPCSFPTISPLGPHFR